MFYQKLDFLCKQRGITITTLAKDLHLSANSGTRWKKGQCPNGKTVEKIATYLNVTTDYLLSDNELKNRPLSQNESILLEMFAQLNQSDQLRFIGRLEEFIELKNS